MARRRRLSTQELIAVARRAVDEIAAAGDVDAAAASMLERAHGAALKQAILETSVSAPDRITGAVVAAAVHSGEPELTRAAADLLGDISKGPHALDVLRACFTSDDASVRGRAVDALEGYHDPAVLELLSGALLDEATSVRRSATGAVGLLMAARYHPLSAPTIAQMSDPTSRLARAILENEDVHVRRQGAQALGFVPSDVLLPVIARLCEDEDVEVRQEAVLALAAIGSPAAIDLMGRRLSDESYRVASSVLDMLAARLGAGSNAMLEHVKAAMRHPREEVRRQAVLMLGDFPPADVVETLTAASRDEDFEVARRAGESLLRLHGSGDIDWLGRRTDGQTAGERTLSLWEAGNIGIVAGSRAATLKTGGGVKAADVVPMLEEAVRHGSGSDKIHAINELSNLVDITDSPAMREALNDRDASVRSCAADTLFRTRDAGLLVEVVRTHPDSSVRQRATEVLSHNPGGRARAVTLAGMTEFSGERSSGMTLFSAFLAALNDADEGVRQGACEALRGYADAEVLLPVGPTARALDALAEDARSSSLVQEDAAHASEAVRGVDFPKFIADAVDELIQWHRQLARQAVAVRWDEGAGNYALKGVSGDMVKGWQDYGLTPDQFAEVQQAGLGGGLAAATAGPILRGLAADLSAACAAVAAGARALGLVGQEGFAERLAGWDSHLADAPPPTWGSDGSGPAQRVARARAAARIEVACAAAHETGQPPAGIDELAGSDDDWTRLAALRVQAERGEATEASEAARRELADICRTRAGEADYAEPVGRAAAAMLATGQRGAAEWAAGALNAADTDLRVTLTQKLMTAAEDDACAEAVGACVTAGGASGVADVLLRIALRGAGRQVADPINPDAAARFPALALRCLANDLAAADELNALLRGDDTRARYEAGSYLALARVRTAIPIFASVRDQDVAAMLRALCAGASTRSGHPAVPWFDKVLKSVAGRVQAEVAMYLFRAVEHTIPLMLRCSAVNAGRFV